MKKIKSLTIHPSLFNIANQISTTEPYKEDNRLMFFTDGSKTEMGTGCSYCAFENGIKVLKWNGKLEIFHTVLQAELMELKEATIRASQGNEISKIWTDRLSSVMAVLILKPLINLSETFGPFLHRTEIFWLDGSKPMLATGVMKKPILSPKKSPQKMVMKALNPRCELKQHLQELFFKKWQNLWYNGNTGRSVHKVLKTAQLKPVFWTREEILFVTHTIPLIP
ncbi:hypothetical protein AVEN_235399-1 [Araneus ventricosus]|uniref:RNase H type-1 domain-containing protein n=1 Tax=Araneus ventricosus TaxID=182803 RepID=A0A4Y2A417_ARAVE|nr:hypothetical protein AVEN_235399-1 [Araneus ventricosus]